MPITILPGQPGPVVGPGIAIQLISDFIGPLPSGSFWDVQMYTGVEWPSGLVTAINANATSTNSGPLHIMVTDAAQSSTLSQTYPTEGENVKVRAELHSPTATIDSGLITVPWSPTRGLGTQIQLQPTSGSSTGGLTPAQDQALTMIQMSSAFQLGGNWTEPVSDLLSLAGQRLTGQTLIGDFSGTGTFTDPGDVFPPTKFGIAFLLVDKPEGVGVDEANPDQLELDWLELSLMQTKNPIGSVPRSSEWFRQMSGYVFWALDVPTAVSFYVLPGCVVRLWWMVPGGAAG